MALLFLDESLPPQLTEAIRLLGFEAVHVIDAGIAGSPDDVVYAAASHAASVLVTLDLDFADIRRFRGLTPIIVLRPRASLSRSELIEFATNRLDRYRAQIDELGNAIMILTAHSCRIRRKT